MTRSAQRVGSVLWYIAWPVKTLAMAMDLNWRSNVWPDAMYNA
jgi:hypothetical protein